MRALQSHCSLLLAATLDTPSYIGRITNTTFSALSVLQCDARASCQCSASLLSGGGYLAYVQDSTGMGEGKAV